jgi:hypothetical protein
MSNFPRSKSSSSLLSRGARVATGLATALLVAVTAHAAPYTLTTINVVGPNGESIPGYRWLIQEDTMKKSVPGAPAVPGQTLAVSFHTSYVPPVDAGCISCAANPGAPPPVNKPATSVSLDDTKKYYLSVLPNSGYSIGGAQIAPGQTSVTVVCQTLPLPTGQLSVFVFEDNTPINNEPDLPEERGLEGFTLTLIDAGGTYGMSGGQISQDAYGNPLGTTYNPCPAADPGCTPTVATLGSGVVKTDANGYAIFQNLSPGKYTIEAIPPAGQDWHQTATIEGTKGIDAWIKPNEPPFFAEFGPPGYHVFVGFVHTINDTSFLTGGSTITGRIVNLHNSRPPEFDFYAGDPVPGAWVGLNTGAAGAGRGVYAQACDPLTGTFSIPNVPPGTYQLAVWDETLDLIFDLEDITVPDGGAPVDLHDVPVFNWFSKLDAMVFYDANENGFRDPGEVGVNNQAVNLRFRDGSIYQSLLTDPNGEAHFTEVFPFFNWLITEVDYARFKATGATIVVDAGGPVNPDQGWAFPSRDKLNPQEQYCTQADIDAGVCASLGAPLVNPNTGNNLSRTETGPVLLEGIQPFLSQTNVIEFGKKAYTVGENGGITGIVEYGITRAENDPRYAVAEPWEPGIPRVEVVLYQDNLTNATGSAPPDKIIDDLNGDGEVTRADVDNYPFGWADGGPMGPEDVKRNGDTACAATLSCTFDKGDALEVAWTDSWDDKLPTGCQGDIFTVHGQPTDCFDGLRNFGQIRPAVFDGGFAFGSPAGEPDLPVGTYIVEAVAPPGYEHIKEEDKNVDFGDSYTPPTMLLLPAECVGLPHELPQYLSLFPDQQVDNPSNFPYVAGKMSPLCDLKQVTVAQGQNAAANFFLFTETPTAGHVVGFILDDLSNEFDQTSPNFGEKYAPPWLPISIRDWTGTEIGRVYSDEYGTFNALVPSTYTINAPIPSGVAPGMVTTCMNSPGPILDTRPGSPTLGQMIEDPYFNRQYSQFCYTFQYLPGKTTYLDTPVVPVAAFAGPGQFPLDCELPDRTPVIYSASAQGNGAGGGPWVPSSGTAAQRTLTILSMGTINVPNPSYDGPGGTQPKTIQRDYGFGGTAGTVRVGSTTLTVAAGNWSNGLITVVVPGNAPSGELVVTRADSQKSSITGVTVTVGGSTPLAVSPGGSIQNAIDTAQPDTLILVPPGSYTERLIMWKPVRLQGWGAGSVILNAANLPAEQQHQWRQKIDTLVATGSVTLLPNQTGAAVGFPEPTLFVTEEGSGIFVLGKDANPSQGGFGRIGGGPNARPNSRIDGFTITGGDNGGAILVNGYAAWLEISNNRIEGNQGFFGGGIRIGHPQLLDVTETAYVDSQNDNITIHNNHIAENGGLGGVGGGVSICTGADNYRVTGNWICGNFTQGEGGGIGHLGLSDGGQIERNAILFNQSFYQGNTVNGGGILVAGQVSPVAGALSPGSGTVTINANLIQGNLAGAGDGGAIRAQLVNGQDVAASRNQPASWYSLRVFNNMIVNNVAGLAAGAISLQDAARTVIVFNTIANNDSTATAGEAFTIGAGGTVSNPQPAGIVSRATSTELFNAMGNGGSATLAYFKKAYSNPVLYDNIIYHNRSFYFSLDATTDPPGYGLLPLPSSPVYADLAVVGAGGQLQPEYCLLTDTAGYPATNVTPVVGDTLFAAWYTNGPKNLIQERDATSPLQLAPAFDEGGNFIDVRFGPLTITDPLTGLPWGDYHLATNNSPPLAAGTATVPFILPIETSFLTTDFDGNTRPATPDMGADERP